MGNNGAISVDVSMKMVKKNIISVCISGTFFEKIWSTIINKYVLRLETGDPREKLDTQELLSKF